MRFFKYLGANKLSLVINTFWRKERFGQYGRQGSAVDFVFCIYEARQGLLKGFRVEVETFLFCNFLNGEVVFKEDKI